MSHSTWVDQSPHAPILYALRSLAWADGELAPAEVEAIARVAETLDLDFHYAELFAWLSNPPSEPPPSEADAFGRLFVLSQALRLAWVDDEFSATERERISRWAEAWDISTEDVARLEAEVLAERTPSADPFA